MQRANLEFLTILHLLSIFVQQIGRVRGVSAEIIEWEFVSDVINDFLVSRNVKIKLLIDGFVDFIDLSIIFYLLYTVLSINIQVPCEYEGHLVRFLAHTVQKLKKISGLSLMQ